MSDRPLLLLDDDEDFRGLVAEELRGAGFGCTEAATVAEAEALCGPGGFGALILDVALPDGDGRDLCARLRAGGLRVPVLMLTGVDADEDVVRGLDSGAHAYLAKPVRPGELIARLRTLLRLHEISLDAVFTLGPWQFRPAQKLLRNEKGVRIWLTEREVGILRHLQRKGGTVSKIELLSDLWGYNPAVTSHTLETHIYRLRQKIEADPYNAKLLRTVPGEGYRLHADAAA